MDDALTRIAAMTDLEAQGHALAAILRTVDDARRRAVAMRKDLIDRMRDAGYSHSQVASAIERDRSTASQVARGKQTGRRRRDPDHGS